MPTLFLALLLTAAEPLGIARARGSFSAHGHKVWNNATVVENRPLQALLVPVDIRLRTGEAWRLGAGAVAVVVARRLVLQEGTARGSFPIECRGVLIEGGPAQVTLGRDARLRVFAASDAVKVSAPAGVDIRRTAELPDLPGIAEEARLSGRWW
ncbi:MAG: hypothetical protein U0Q16_37475 [Bryobacteraceae bacterium]